ncbi:MAG: glycosyltransferase family 2 protein [Actinomycetota bacterium]|nr:glycosyltransferase family 2 protein [Actinomycetota bacterium]
MTVDLAVVVIAYNSEHVLAGLLDSLPAALGDVRAQVLVVDNGSTDGSVAALRARSDCQVIASTNTGYSGGINTGVRHAEADIPILILNPDARLRPGAVPALLAGLDHPGIGIVAPQVRDDQDRLHLSLRREPSIPRAMGLTKTRLPLFSEYIYEPEAYRQPGIVAWALGAALLISRASYDALGGWDESYFLYSEETDFCLRAADRGFLTRYEPTAVVEHIGAQSGQSAATHTMQVINRVRLYARRHGALAGWTYYLVSLLNEASRIPRGGRGRSVTAVRALLSPQRRPVELGCSDRLLPS